MRLKDVAGVRTAPTSPAAGVRDEPGEAFRALARDQLPRLYAIARRLVGEDAEDAVQECLFKAFQRLDQLREFAAAPAWLTSILINCCHDVARARARRPRETSFEDAETFSLYRKIAYEDPFPYSDSLHLDFLAEFGAEDVHAVLMLIPELYRVPLVLVYMEGYLARETAEMLSVPLGTVLARLHRGRKMFEKQMWEYARTHGLLKEGAAQ